MDIDKTIQKLRAKELTYWEEASAFKEILGTGINQYDLAERLGLKQTTISNKVRLLKLYPEVQQAIKDNNINEHCARLLLKTTDQRLQLKIIDRIAEHGLAGKETERYIEKQLSMCVKSGNVNEFVQMIANGVRSLNSQGINIKSGKTVKGSYTDIIVRVYK